VVAKIAASQVNDIGLAYDFTLLKRHLGGIVDRFDHACLNDMAPFDKINPSSGNIASTIYHELDPRLTEDPVSLSFVEVWESPDSWVTYSPD
jgi:6-pyruvoyltetrahydropterin/6-carboxytetrahydropterin synthase